MPNVTIVTFAGYMAHVRVYPEVFGDGLEPDVQTYEVLIPKLCEQTSEETKVWKWRISSECKKIVNERWVAIEALAQELLKRTTIAGDQAVAIIDAALRE